jgi:glutathione S-transferase
MSGLALYDFELDEGCYRVRLLLSVLGVPYGKIAVNVVPGAEQTRPPLLLLNPLGTLPILSIDPSGAEPLVLRDAEAILAYLAQAHDPARTWLPEAPEAFGAVMTWLTFSARDLARLASARLEALFGAPVDAEATRAAALVSLRVMEDHMTARSFQGGAWFVGAGPTVADIAVFPAFALSRDIGIDHEAYPALRRWMRRVRSLPGFMTMPGIPDYH